MPSAPIRAAIVGAAFAALITLPGLGNGTLWDNSETAYGEVAREILLTRDNVVMHLNGQPWFVQPPLYFWIAALFAKVFGVAPFALRLPSALATIAMGGATGFATARLVDARAGVFAAVILSTSLMQAVVGRLAIMDALLDLCVTATTLWWYRAFEPPRFAAEIDRPKRRRAFVLGAVAAAVGILVKGPVALILPILVVAGWAIWERVSGSRPGRPDAAAIALGLAVMAAIAVPWFVLLVHRAGPHAVTELVAHYSVGRYVGVIENQRGVWYYYLPVVILGFFPWTAFLPPALVLAWRRAGEGSDFARFAIAWAVLPIVFFSFAQTKLPNYIALEWPALAILTAIWFDDVSEGRARLAAIIATCVIPLTMGIIAIAIELFTRNGQLGAALAAIKYDVIAVGLATFAGSLLTLIAIIAHRERWAPYVLGVCGASVLLVIVFIVEPHAEAFKPIPRLAATIDAQRRPGDMVAISGASGENALVFYTRPRVFALETIDGTLDSRSTRLICFAPRLFLITGRRDSARMPTVGRNRRVIATDERDVLFLYDGPPCERRVSITTRPLASENHRSGGTTLKIQRSTNALHALARSVYDQKLLGSTSAWSPFKPRSRTDPLWWTPG